MRRIVTGNDSAGKAIVLTDEKEAPNQFEPPMRDGVQVNNIWCASECPCVCLSVFPFARVPCNVTHLGCCQARPGAPTHS